MSTRAASDGKMRRITASAMFTALIFVFTAYIHIPTGSGFTHAGDGLIFLAACTLPTPYAVASAAIGGALADGLSGFVIWLPATVVIKAVTVLFFSNKGEKIVTLRNIAALIPSLIVCIVGYSAYEGIVIIGGFSWAAITAALSQTYSYVIQTFASGVLFVIVGTLLDRVGFKRILKTAPKQ